MSTLDPNDASAGAGVSSGVGGGPAPIMFIQWKTIQDRFKLITDGRRIIMTSLLQLDGALLTYAYQEDPLSPQYHDMAKNVNLSPISNPASPKIISALLGNIWRSIETHGAASLGAQQCGLLMMNCEQGNIAVMRISRFLLCIQATNQLELGALKHTISELASSLQALHKVYGDA